MKASIRLRGRWHLTRGWSQSLPMATRLFFSHLITMLVGLTSFIVMSQATAYNLFSGHLDAMADRGHPIGELRDDLLGGFEMAWNGSTLLSLGVGSLAAMGLSYWVAHRITFPLSKMERIAQQFAAGHLAERVPGSNIPELAQLSASFNRMAVSLQDVEQRRRQMIGDLTHELRTPLTIVRGYLEEVAAQELALMPNTAQMLVRETRRLERLVSDLQELSKAEAGHLPLHLQPVAIAPLFEHLVRRFEGQIVQGGPGLQWSCTKGLPTVLADPDRLEQILVNLLGNALRHTAAGYITLSAWADDPVWIAVTDTGSGIAAADLPHVFDRFWRAPQVQAQKLPGTGIGLAITKRLIELQDGHIEVSSTLGRGTTFKFCLPKV